MPIVEFPFIFSSKQTTWCPQLPIGIVNTNEGYWVDTYGVIDTGSEYCYLPFDIVEEIKISLDEEKDKTSVTCSGLPRDGYESDAINIKIYNVIDVPPDKVFVEDNVIVELTPARVVFVLGLKNPLLGVKGFLNDYVLTINYQLEKFSVQTPHGDRPCPICRPPN